MNNQLKPCPFCGNSTPFSRQVSGRFYVKCGVCHAMAGEYEDKEAALNAWNTRPASEVETRDGLQQAVDDLSTEVDRLVRENEQLKRELLADFVPDEGGE